MHLVGIGAGLGASEDQFVVACGVEPADHPTGIGGDADNQAVAAALDACHFSFSWKVSRPGARCPRSGDLLTSRRGGSLRSSPTR